MSNSIKSLPLKDQIEIIREQSNTPAQPLTPPESDDSNPLNALNELVERLEAIENLSISNVGHEVEDNSKKEGPESYLSQASHYLELFQKQSLVLKKIMTKLN